MPSPPDAPPTSTTQRLWWVLLLFAAIATLGFFYAVSQRLFYPHELEWMEGALADHASRIADGLPLYCEPQADHVPFLYAPLLFWLGGLGMKLGLDGILALRLIAVVFSLGSATLIGQWVRKESGKLVPGLVATGLYLAGYGWLAWWYDLARNDSLFVFFALATAYQLRHGGNKNWLWAGLLAAVALLAKQSALLWLPAVGVGALCWNWRIGLRFGLVALAAMFVPIGLMHLMSDGWSTFYLFEMPQHHGWVGDRKLGYWTEDIVPMLPLVGLGLAGFLACVRNNVGSSLYLAAFGCGALACSWFSRMHVGGFDNVMMYGFAGACVLGPIAATHGSRAIRIGGPIVLLLQFGTLAYRAWQRPVRTLLPTAVHRQAHDELAAYVRDQSGPVWIPGHGHVTYRAGKGTGAHGQAIFDLLQMLPPGPGGFDVTALDNTAELDYLSQRARKALDCFRENCSDALRRKQYAAIVLEQVGTGGAFEFLFRMPLAGPDATPDTADDPYQRRPGPLQQPAAIAPLLGFPVHSPYLLVRKP